MQKISDEPLTVCETCGGKLEKQWSLSGFQFKGAGWYVTDYSSKGKDGGADKANKDGKSENTEKTEKTEKTSAVESTAKTEIASNKSNDTAAATTSKKEAAKKD
jgi:predicted nucleic acid-binding Zn ribbon protein